MLGTDTTTLTCHPLDDVMIIKLRGVLHVPEEGNRVVRGVMVVTLVVVVVVVIRPLPRYGNVEMKIGIPQMSITHHIDKWISLQPAIRTTILTVRDPTILLLLLLLLLLL